MDNLPAHKAAGVREAIEQTGAALLLPPYSRDFNSIENAFSSSRRCCAPRPLRTIKSLWDAVGSLLDQIHSSAQTNSRLQDMNRIKQDAL